MSNWEEEKRTRLQVGMDVLIDGREFHVDLVNQSRARCVPIERRRREIVTRAGDSRVIEAPGSPINISPNSEVPIIRYVKTTTNKETMPTKKETKKTQKFKPPKIAVPKAEVEQQPSQVLYTKASLREAMKSLEGKRYNAHRDFMIKTWGPAVWEKFLDDFMSHLITSKITGKVDFDWLLTRMRAQIPHHLTNCL